MTKDLEFTIGGMWEFSDWKVVHNEKISYFDGPACKHCYGKKTETRTNCKGGTYPVGTIYCPRVIIVKNEAGFNSTGLCLDCVLEAFEGEKK